MDRVVKNRFWWIFTASSLLYGLLTFLLPIHVFNEVLNGIFIGISCTIVYVFRRMLLKSIWTREPFNDIRMLSFAVLMGGISIALFCSQSIFNNITGNPTPAQLVSLAKYCAIAGGIGLLLAPGYYDGYLHGEEKRVVWIGVAIGLIIATLLVYLQVTVSETQGVVK